MNASEARARRRRPPGFVAPGPRPAGDQGLPELMPGAEEDLCYLSGDFRIFQRRDGHRWSLDDLLTAWVALEEAAGHGAVQRAADLGCGIGSVLLMVAWGLPAARVVGLEAQELSVGLCQRSLVYNGTSGRCAVLRGDLRAPPEALLAAGPFDLVTGTPPYIPVGQGVMSARVQRGPCCFEVRGGVEAYCEAARRILAPGGRLVLCAGALAPRRVEGVAPGLGLRVTRRVEVVPKEGKAPLLLVYALEAGAGGAARAERLVVRRDDGAPSEALLRVRERLGMPPPA